MNPNFDPNQNPFQSIIAGLKNPNQAGAQPGGQPGGIDLASMMGASGGAQSQDPTQGQPQPQGGPAGGMPTIPGAPTLPPSQLEQGKNPSSTKPLVQAITALQNYIATETDRDNILLGRNIIKLLTQLVTKSEDAQLGNLQKGY